MSQVKRRPIDLVALRAIHPIRVLTLHGWHPTLHQGEYYRGPCIWRECACKHVRIMRVGPQLAKCYRCQRWGDAVSLHATFTGKPVYEAALDLCDRLRMEVPYI